MRILDDRDRDAVEKMARDVRAAVAAWDHFIFFRDDLDTDRLHAVISESFSDAWRQFLYDSDSAGSKFPPYGSGTGEDLIAALRLLGDAVIQAANMLEADEALDTARHRF